MFDFNNAINADPSRMGADEALNHLTSLRAAKDDLKAADDKALDRLDQLADEGEIDRGGFSHNDWSISWSLGRRSWVYPESVKALEAQTRGAKKAAEADGSATATTGVSFWTIKRPGS